MHMIESSQAAVIHKSHPHAQCPAEYWNLDHLRPPQHSAAGSSVPHTSYRTVCSQVAITPVTTAGAAAAAAAPPPAAHTRVRCDCRVCEPAAAPFGHALVAGWLARVVDPVERDST